MNKFLMALVLICFLAVSSNSPITFVQKHTNRLVTTTDIKNIPDSQLSKMSDTGLVKIGYDSFLTNKLFDYMYLEDVSFDRGKLKIGTPLKKTLSNYPKSIFKKLRINDIEAEDGFWEQPTYFISEHSYFYAEADMNGKNNNVLSIVVKDNKVKMDKIALNIGDPIISICDYFKISCMELKQNLDTTSNKDVFAGKEQYVDIVLYEKHQKRSKNFLRYVWDKETQKIIRIEVTFN